MALNNLGLGFVFTAKNLASGTMTRLKGQLNGLGAQAKFTGVAMKAGFAIAAAGIVPLIVGLSALSVAMSLGRAAGEFEEGLAAIAAVTKATVPELEALRDTAIEAGIATQFSPVEAVEGLKSLATAGLTAGQAMKSLTPVLDLAAGSLGQLGVAGAAEAVVGTLNAYGQTAEMAAGVTDKLLRITQLSNFQTRDFATGLSKAAAAGAVFGQDLDEVLTVMGLLRNANIDASSASTAFRESVRRLGSDQRAQNAITAQGVDVFDKQTGEMRNLTDISQDLAVATKDMTAEERNRIIVQGFGARGLLAFNAIAGATTTTMIDGQKVTLRNAEAIAFLKDNLKTATGTAEEFRQKMLDTFEGQKKLLKGTLETLAIVFGEPFAKVFKPLVSVLVNSLNVVLQVVNDMPKGLKTMSAAFFVAGGVVLTFAGIIGILTGLMIVLSPFLLVIAKVLLIATIATLPFIAAMAASVAAVAAMVFAIRSNLGGLGDMFKNALARVSLVWTALKELFTRGGLTKAVADELNKTENQGLKRFVLAIFRIGKRVDEFITGFKAGFMSASAVLTPVFRELRSAFFQLAAAFGFVEEGAQGLADTPMDDFAANGIVMGQIMANVLGSIVRGITRVILFMGDFVDGMRFLSSRVRVEMRMISDMWLDMRDNVVLAIASTIAGLGRMAGLVPAPLRGAVLSGLAESATAAQAQADAAQRALNRRQIGRVLPELEVRRGIARRARGRAETRARLDEQAEAGPRGVGGADLLAVLSAQRAEREKDRQAMLALATRPVQVTTVLDGVKVGEGTSNAARGEADAAFVPGTPADAT